MYKEIQTLPTAEQLQAKHPLTPKQQATKLARDEDVRRIIDGRDNRKILVIGPCSAHCKDATLDYVKRLAKVQEQVKDSLVIVPRIYTGKPRTTGKGYKGSSYESEVGKGVDIAKGLSFVREMMIDAIDCGLPPADEMLNHEFYPHLADVLTYVAVGARSSENQSHRHVASGGDVPFGLKNPTSGNWDVAFNSIEAAHSEQVFGYNGHQVETPGNKYAHLILRGYERDGVVHSNYHYEDIARANEEYKKRGLANPAIIVDTNHSNSCKKYYEQPRIAHEILSHMKNPEFAKIIKGLMIESFIIPGSQKADGKVYGQSITDPCLGWEETEKLIHDIADTVKGL